MESRRINTELSRVLNGNFSSSSGGWEGDFETDSAIKQVEGTEAPRSKDEPLYDIRLIDGGEASCSIPFRDLSVFPSVLRFPATLTPRDYDSYMVTAQEVYGAPPNPVPFGYLNGSTWEMIEVGVPIVVDGTVNFGEYRIQKVVSRDVVYVVPTTDPPASLAGGSSASYYRESGNNVFAVNLPSAYAQTGDYFVCKTPVCGGLIYAVSGNTIFVNPGAGNQPPPVTYDIGDPIELAAMGDWKILASFSASILRSLPVVLYDLTLAYDSSKPVNINPGMVRVQLFDELDQLTLALYPIAIDGTAQFIERVSTSDFARRVQRFLRELKYPVYGKARISFSRASTSTTLLGNVSLYRGNYVEKILSAGSDKVDFVESQVQMDAEIVPKGTIVAYTGGPVCPPGFVGAEGIGGEVGDKFLGQGPALYAREADPHEFILSVSLDQRTSRDGKTDPRTICLMDRNELHRSMEALGALTYQKSKRLVNIIPYRYDITHHLYWDFIKMRAEFLKDPHPEWVVDMYDHVDVIPGAILRLEWDFSAVHQKFMKRADIIVSQFALGKFIDHFYEEEPTHPFGEADSGGAGGINVPSEKRRRAIRQVNEGGADRNRVYQAYSMYGNFVPVYEERALMELVGDWVSVVTAAMADSNARASFWKSGILAQAQTHPELGDDDCYGGYGLWAEPHTHDMDTSADVTTLPNIDPGDPHYAIPVPTRHRHGVMFGAATLPKVRPVLLCQKI